MRGEALREITFSQSEAKRKDYSTQHSVHAPTSCLLLNLNPLRKVELAAVEIRTQFITETSEAGLGTESRMCTQMPLLTLSNHGGLVNSRNILNRFRTSSSNSKDLHLSLQRESASIYLTFSFNFRFLRAERHIFSASALRNKGFLIFGFVRQRKFDGRGQGNPHRRTGRRRAERPGFRLRR